MGNELMDVMMKRYGVSLPGMQSPSVPANTGFEMSTPDKAPGGMMGGMMRNRRAPMRPAGSGRMPAMPKPVRRF